MCTISHKVKKAHSISELGIYVANATRTLKLDPILYKHLVNAYTEAISTNCIHISLFEYLSTQRSYPGVCKHSTVRKHTTLPPKVCYMQVQTTRTKNMNSLIYINTAYLNSHHARQLPSLLFCHGDQDLLRVSCLGTRLTPPKSVHAHGLGQRTVNAICWIIVEFQLQFTGIAKNLGSATPVVNMVFSDYTKQRIICYYNQRLKAPAISRRLAEEGIKASRVGVHKFLRSYQRSASIARHPGSGRKSKITDEVKKIVEEKMMR